MKRVAATLYYEKNIIYVVPTEVHDNPYVPEIALSELDLKNLKLNNKEMITMADCEFHRGDMVRLKNVSEEDVSHGRYVGEIGIFQDLWNYNNPSEENSAQVRFGNWGGYIVFLEDLELVARADVTTIFIAHCMEKETDLMRDIKTLFEGKEFKG